VNKNEYIVISQNDSLGLKIIYQVKDSKYFLTALNKKNTIDTIQIDLNEDGFYDIIDCELSSKQLDGKGRNEVVIDAVLNHRHGAGLNGVEVTRNVVQIWNLDNKKKIFSTTKSYFISGTAGEFLDEFDIVDNDTIYIHEACHFECSYKYEIEFIDNSKTIKIMIKNLNSTFDNQCSTYEFECEKPDHNQGLYVIKNGIYTRQEEKNGR